MASPTPSPLAAQILPSILPLLSITSHRPIVFGISGPQGSGKSTVTSELHTLLSSSPYNLKVLSLSIDDLYYPFLTLQTLASQNPLYRVRGLPGTHDVELGERVIADLRKGEGEVKVPRFDKSRFGGRGDRVEEEAWDVVGGEGRKVDIVLLEGWCVGMTAVEEVGEDAVKRWGEGVKEVNQALKGYEGLWGEMEGLVHIDAEDIKYVYTWRLQQERAMREIKGMGMTDEEVKAFVDCYMPGYELYNEELRKGTAMKKSGKNQLRVVVGEKREILKIEEL